MFKFMLFFQGVLFGLPIFSVAWGLREPAGLRLPFVEPPKPASGSQTGLTWAIGCSTVSGQSQNCLWSAACTMKRHLSASHGGEYSVLPPLLAVVRRLRRSSSRFSSIKSGR